MMSNSNAFQVKSIVPVWYQYIILLLFGGVTSGVFVWLFLWILDGNDWYLIGSSLILNLIVLFILGAIISHFYFKAEFMRFKEGHISFEDDEIKVIKDNRALRIYKKNMFMRTRIDQHFYFIFGYQKITLVIAPLRGNKNQIESILVHKKDIKPLYDRIENYRKSIHIQKDTLT